MAQIQRKCKLCRRVFYVERWKLKQSKCIFCSHKCSNTYNLYKRPQTFKKGQKAWNKGIKMLQMSEWNAYQWKGDDVGYFTLHKWVARHKGKPDTCLHCERTNLSGRSIHWANRSGQYRRDLGDWIRLCVWCHGKFDGTFIKKGQHLSPDTEFKRGVL